VVKTVSITTAIDSSLPYWPSALETERVSSKGEEEMKDFILPLLKAKLNGLMMRDN
jgi:hypothetical protein